MFKNAYVRGIQTALINQGIAAFPDKVTADKVADYIADRIDIDLTNGVPREVTHKVATDLVAASDWIKKQPGFKAAAWNKLASWDDVMKLADDNATQLMEKAAEGSTIEGGDKGNDEPQSPHGESKMDTKQRPPGYATDSRGETDVDTRPGAVGKEEEQPNAPKETDKKDNSPQDQSRTASATLASLFKAATGSTIMGGDKGNTPTEVTHAEGKMDQAQRPVGYATFGMKGVGSLGEVMKAMTGPAIVGRETPNPNAPAATDKKTNSPLQTTAKAAEEDPFITLFKKTAAEIHEYLPTSLDEDAKIATVRACMGLTTEEKARYLVGLQKEAAEKTAATPPAVPPGSRGDNYQQHNPEATHSRPGAYDGRKGNQGTKSAEDGGFPPFMKKEEKKDDGEKKDDDKEKSEKKDDGEKKDLPPWMKEDKEKEASLREHMRKITEAQRAS